MMLNHKAVQKPSTEKPTTIFDDKRISKALITKVNKPSVKILIGKVRINKIGLMTALIMPSTKANKTAVQKPVRTTPGKR